MVFIQEVNDGLLIQCCTTKRSVPWMCEDLLKYLPLNLAYLSFHTHKIPSPIYFPSPISFYFLFQIFPFSLLPLLSSLSFSPSWEKCFFPSLSIFSSLLYFAPPPLLTNISKRHICLLKSSFHLTKIRNYQESSGTVKNIVLVESPRRQALSLLYSPQDFLSPGEQKLLKTQT